MGRPTSSPGSRRAAITLAVVSIFLVPTSFAGGVFSGGVFEEKKFSEGEVFSLRVTVSDFIARLPDLSKTAAAEEIEDLYIEGVRYTRYYGFVGNAFNQNFSFRVAVDSRSPQNNRVVSFTDRGQRNLLDNCVSDSSETREKINLSTAYDSAIKFLELQSLRRVTDGMSEVRSELGRFGSEEYYQFVWREHYGEDGISRMLGRVELLVNPTTGAVFSFKCTLSQPEDYDSFDPGIIRDSVYSSAKSEGEIRIGKMALFLDHSRDGSKRPVWAVTLHRFEGDRLMEDLVFVDAESGILLDE